MDEFYFLSAVSCAIRTKWDEKRHSTSVSSGRSASISESSTSPSSGSSSPSSSLDSGFDMTWGVSATLVTFPLSPVQFQRADIANRSSPQQYARRVVPAIPSTSRRSYSLAWCRIRHFLDEWTL